MERFKTKIVCTLGPATDSADGIRALLDTGMDVVRLNFSHGTADVHERSTRLVRGVASELDRQVAQEHARDPQALQREGGAGERRPQRQPPQHHPCNDR